MAQEIGESREAWGADVWKMAEAFADHLKSDLRPFYIVYACKQDKAASERLGRAAFRQVIKAYYDKPPALLGILVWYVDNRIGEFRFCPELSAPPDVPLDPTLLSDKASDASERVMEQGKKLNALVS
jgi:hypothetical protein